MSLKERTINVDIMTKEYTKLKYKQGDSNQTLKFKFYKNGSELDLTGYVVGIFYEKPNNEILEKTGNINGNIVTTTITSGILNTSGIVKTEIFLTNNDEVSISFTILIEVESSIDKNAAVQEKEEWDIIKDLLIKADNIAMIDDSLTATNKTWSSSKISSQIKEKANKVDLETQKARIDTFVSLHEGSTTGDAELIDGRVGADGVVSPNLGDSIRRQINNLKDQINKMKLTDNLMKTKFLYGKGVFTKGITQGSTIVLGGDAVQKGRTPYFYKPKEASGFILEPKAGYKILLISTYDKTTIEELWADDTETKVVISSDNSLLYMFKCTKIDGTAIDTSEVPFKLSWIYEEEKILNESIYNSSQIKNLFKDDNFRLSMLSKLVRGGLLNGEVYYGIFTDYNCKRWRVTTEDIIKFTKECNLIIDPDYRIGIHFYENGVFYKDSNWITSGIYTIPKGSECRIVISRKIEDETEIADIKEFDSAISVVCKTNDNNDVFNFRDNSYIKEIFSGNNPSATEYLQGGCTDGEYLYYCFTYNSWGLYKFDLKAKQVVKTIDKDSGGGYYAHANDLAYDSLNDVLVVAYTTNDTITLAKINKDTLKSIGTLALNNEEGNILKAYGIGYNRNTNQFYVGEEDNFSKIYVFNSNFEKEKVLILSNVPTTTSTEYLHQSIECDGKYIYILYTKPNCIYVYDMEGNFVKSINIITDYEVESLSYDWNGNFYLTTAVHGETENSYKIYYINIFKYITAEFSELLL